MLTASSQKCLSIGPGKNGEGDLKNKEAPITRHPKGQFRVIAMNCDEELAWCRHGLMSVILFLSLMPLHLDVVYVLSLLFFVPINSAVCPNHFYHFIFTYYYFC